jgi:hypothetical protein
MFRLILILISCSLLILNVQRSYSQNLITGEVKDLSALAIPGARITLFNATQTFLEEERTNSSLVLFFRINA